MADAIDVSQYPPGSILVPGNDDNGRPWGVQPVVLRAGYVNGRWPTAVQAGTEVTIDVNGSRPDADVADVEIGDITPDAFPGWARDHNSRGGFPAVCYCNRSTMAPVANACAAAGLQVVRDYRWWPATLDGTRKLADMTGVVAVQAWGAQFFGGRNIDLSIVVDDTWHGTGAPDMDITELYNWRDDHGRNMVDFSNFATDQLWQINALLVKLAQQQGVSAQDVATALAPQIIAVIKGMDGNFDEAAIEAALRKVLGSVDNPPG
jgi:hypothetical protein